MPKQAPKLKVLVFEKKNIYRKILGTSIYACLVKVLIGKLAHQYMHACMLGQTAPNAESLPATAPACGLELPFFL